MNQIEMKMIKDKSNLCQIYSNGVEFSLANKNNRQLLHWAFCKDYISDWFWNTANKELKCHKQYGMEYKYKRGNTLKGNKILICNKEWTLENLTSNIQNSVSLINDYFKKEFPTIEIEGTFLDKSTVEEHDNSGKKVFREIETPCLVLTLPEDYTLAPPIVSLLLALLRVGINYKENSTEYIDNFCEGKIEGTNANDKNYISAAQTLLLAAKKDGFKSFFSDEVKKNWPKEKGMNWIHNSSGISSYGNWYKNNKGSFLDYINPKPVNTEKGLF